jgi:predicted dithiol-disulfide oxidoreductase (DUF899 family)
MATLDDVPGHTSPRKEQLVTTIEKPSAPPVVSRDEWWSRRQDLLLEEKRLTRELDALAAKRRRLPMTQMGRYEFASPTGKTTLLDLFADQPQLVVYQFMDVGPEHFCPGCTHFTDEVVDLSTVYEHGARWATISDMPIEQMAGYWEAKGWDVPFYSSAGTTFSADCGGNEGFMLNCFLRVDDDVYQTYSTTGRGVDRVMFTTNILDLLPYGRQEAWEDSPAGWPKSTD